MPGGESSPKTVQHRLNRLEDKVEQDHDPRITRNERYRLQMQGALKIIALILGSGGLAYLVSALPL